MDNTHTPNNPESSNGRSSEILRSLRIIGTIASLAILFWLFIRLDLAKLWLTVSQLHIERLLLVLMLFWLGELSNSIRWYILLRAQAVDMTPLESLKVIMAGAYASNFLPSTIGGDSVRILIGGKKAKEPVIGLSSVILDRIINVVAMFSLSPIPLTVFWPQVSSMVPIAIVLSIGFQLGTIFQRKSNLIDWIKRRWRIFRRSLVEWGKSPHLLVAALLISYVSVIVVFLGIWLIAIDLSISVGFLEVVAVSVTVYFLTLFPISINGYGLRELSVVALYLQLGADLNAATALALVTRAVRLVETIPGVIWLPGLLSKE